MSAEDNSWRSPSFRQNVVQKIEEAVRTSGMNPSKNSLEMENHVFQKAKSKEDYLGYVARLILHVREMNRCRFPSFIETYVVRKTPETPEEIKENGNIFFTRKMYNEALIFYDKAISLNNSSALFYGNRAACYMMLGEYCKAVKDASASVCVDPSYIKGHVRLLKCYIALGEIALASEALKKVLSLDSSSKVVENEIENLDSLKNKIRDILKSMESKDYSTAISLINSAVVVAMASSYLKGLKAECHVYLQQFKEAKALANELKEADHSTFIFISGLCFYYEGNIEMAIAHFETTNFSPGSPTGKKVHDFFRKALEFRKLKSEGNNLFEKGQFALAYNLYSTALTIDLTNRSTNSKLYFNRGTVNFKLYKFKDAIADYSKAIDLDSNYFKALSKRGQCYVKLNEYEKAVFDFEKAFRGEPVHEHKKMLDDAKAKLTQSKRKDYYKILGITRAASVEEIKKAYRKRAMIHHPDRHVNSTETEKVDEEKKFKELGEAYAVLSDPVKKADYDRSISCVSHTTGHRYTHNAHMQSNFAPHTFTPSSSGFNASVYMTRATAFWKTGAYTQAREAALEAIQRDPTCTGAYICLLKCHIANGDIGSAESLVIQLRKSNRLPNNAPDLKFLSQLKVLSSKAEKYMNTFQYLFASRVIDDARNIAPASIPLKLWKAESLIYLNKDIDAKQILDSIGLAETHYLAPHLRYVNGLLHYMNCEFHQAAFVLCNKAKPSSLVYAKRCEDLAKLSIKLKDIKEEANTAYSKGNYKGAIQLYSTALQIDPRLSKYNSVIYANRAAAYYQLKDLKASIQDCSAALRLDPAYQKALLRRAQCHSELKQYSAAHSDFLKLFTISKNPEHEKLMKQNQELAALNKSVINIDSDDDEADVEKIKKTPRQTKIGDYIGKNLRKRTRQNYKVNSESENDEPDSKEKAPSPKKSKNVSNDEEESGSNEGETHANCSPKKSTEKASTSKSTKKPTTRNLGIKKRNLRRVKCVSSSESESSAEASIQSLSESESSDSEEVFVKKTIGGKKKKVSLDSDSDEVDLGEIKNTYRTRVVRKFSEYKYKKVVGGKKNKKGK